MGVNTEVAGGSDAAASQSPMPRRTEIREVRFVSGGAARAATLYVPAAHQTAKHPCVVMAHGFSAVRDQALPAFAARFAAAAIAVLTFDYRSFGTNEGEPRLDI